MAAGNGSSRQNRNVICLNPWAFLQRITYFRDCRQAAECLFNYFCITAQINAFGGTSSPSHKNAPPPPTPLLLTLTAHSAIHPFRKSSGKLGGSMESSPPVKVNYIAAHGAQPTKMQKSTCCGKAINCRDWKRKSTVLGIKWPKLVGPLALPCLMFWIVPI